jgi:hypothetical protein
MSDLLSGSNALPVWSRYLSAGMRSNYDCMLLKIIQHLHGCAGLAKSNGFIIICQRLSVHPYRSDSMFVGIVRYTFITTSQHLGLYLKTKSLAMYTTTITFQISMLAAIEAGKNLLVARPTNRAFLSPWEAIIRVREA